MSVTLLALGACSIDSIKSTDIDPETIYQIYSADYDADDQSLTVSAQFRSGGSTGTSVELADGSTITHNLFTLSKSSSSGTSYRYFATGVAFASSHTWTWLDGKTQVSRSNSVEIHEIGLPSPSLSTLSKAASATISWTGSALAANETITLILADDTQSSEVVTTSLTGGTSVTVTSADLDALNAGTFEMSFNRVYSPDLSEATTEGGTISGSYRSARASITLTN